MSTPCVAFFSFSSLYYIDILPPSLFRRCRLFFPHGHSRLISFKKFAPLFSTHQHASTLPSPRHRFHKRLPRQCHRHRCRSESTPTLRPLPDHPSEKSENRPRHQSIYAYCCPRQPCMPCMLFMLKTLSPSLSPPPFSSSLPLTHQTVSVTCGSATSLALLRRQTCTLFRARASRKNPTCVQLPLELLREYKPEASWDDKERHNKVLRQSPQHWRAALQLAAGRILPMPL